jgi:hypothetical protein
LGGQIDIELRALYERLLRETSRTGKDWGTARDEIATAGGRR